MNLGYFSPPTASNKSDTERAKAARMRSGRILEAAIKIVFNFI
jgi:hypothetical protein